MSFKRAKKHRWNEMTALFGGRFDPPHLGHREAVRGLFEYPGVKEVLILPSGSAPHKPTLAKTAQRAEMAKLAFSSIPSDGMPAEVRLELMELEKAEKTGTPTYSFDTLTQLKPHYPNLAFVVGADQIAALHTWYRFPDLLNLCNWIVLERKPDGSSLARKILQEWESSGLVKTRGANTWESKPSGHVIQIVPTQAQALSSTEIREEIARTGEPPQGCLLPSVWNYLKEHHLYGV